MKSLTRVLVVHEDPAIRNLVHLTLGKDTYGVVEAQDVDAAIRMASTWGADLLVVQDDLPTPGAGAIIATLRADEVTRDIRVLLLGDKANPPSADRQAQLDVDAVLTAPFGAYTLLQACDALRAVTA